MNTEIMKQFEGLEVNDLSSISGGWWDFSGLFSVFSPATSVDQLNGKWPVRNPPKACSPYGTGGTPNSCNGI